MGFFWPDAIIEPAPSPLARAGRVLHWVSLIFAVAPASLGAYLLWQWFALPDQDSFVVAMSAACFGMGLATGLAGRGLRYILAGE